jgi:hypothetical protein
MNISKKAFFRLLSAAILCTALLAANGAGAEALSAAADDGVYLAATNTYYLNPDTGVTDDGGSKNAAIGEGMCRSVIYEKALVEIDGDRVYATVRVQLVSNMGAIKFTVQQKAGDPASYVSVSPRVVAEDAGADTADYRFEIPAADSYIGCATYVTPMGRDVKFYMNLSNNLTAGSGDFVVSIRRAAAALEAAQSDPAAATRADAALSSDAAKDAGATPPAEANAAEQAGQAAPAGGGTDASEPETSETGENASGPEEAEGADETTRPGADAAEDESDAAALASASGGTADADAPETSAAEKSDSADGAAAENASADTAREASETRDGAIADGAAAGEASAADGAATGPEAAQADSGGGISGALVGAIALIAAAVIVGAVFIAGRRKPS